MSNENHILIRIVRMSLNPEQVDDFLLLFNQTKSKILAFEGCRHLELMQDYRHPNILFTYSHWVNEKALDSYRKSDFFKDTWNKTKAYFNDKPIAYSMKKYL